MDRKIKRKLIGKKFIQAINLDRYQPTLYFRRVNFSAGKRDKQLNKEKYTQKRKESFSWRNKSRSNQDDGVREKHIIFSASQNGRNFSSFRDTLSKYTKERETTLSSNLSSVLTRKAPRGHAVGRGNSPETLLPRCSTVSSINLLAWFTRTPSSLFLLGREKKSRYSISTFGFGARTR